MLESLFPDDGDRFLLSGDIDPFCRLGLLAQNGDCFASLALGFTFARERLAGMCAKDVGKSFWHPLQYEICVPAIFILVQNQGQQVLAANVRVSALRAHKNGLRRDPGTVVPLKFGKLDDLRERSMGTQRRQSKLRLLNEAAILALWTLMPPGLADGQLR